MRKKIKKIIFVLATQASLLLILGILTPAFAACSPFCDLFTKICTSGCEGCSWCIPGGGGIYNPVISSNVGTGVGAVIIAKFIAEFMSIAFILAGVVLLGMILFSAFEWMTAGGDQNKLKSAQGKLTSALIGFTILVAARAILGFIAGPLGVPWLDTLKITWPTP